MPAASSIHRFCFRGLTLAAAGAVLVACSKRPQDPPAAQVATPAASIDDLKSTLAATRLDQARDAWHRGQPGEALAIAIAAWETEPQNPAAAELAGRILTETRWHVPATILPQGLQVDHVQTDGKSSLWASLSGLANTTVRWNLETLAIERVLFPVDAAPTRTFLVSPNHQSLVIERAGFLLLCNAKSLQPLHDLGPLPEAPVPTSVVVFSPDGLLLAHPTTAANGIIWHLRDGSSGELIRSSEPYGNDRPAPLAASIDRQMLRVLHRDGSILTIPVSPVEPTSFSEPAQAAALTNAWFAANGGTALALWHAGPHRQPVPIVLWLGGPPDDSFIPDKLLENHPWSRQPNLWSVVQDFPSLTTLAINERQLTAAPFAPVRTVSRITAAAVIPDHLITAEENGNVILHYILPALTRLPPSQTITPPDKHQFAALHVLTQAIAAVEFDPLSRQTRQIPPVNQINACRNLDWVVLHAGVANVSLKPIADTLPHLAWRTAGAEAQVPLWNRLAMADASGASWPTLLERSSALAQSPWHRGLSAALALRSGKTTDAAGGEAQPWLAGVAIERAFASGDDARIMAAIAGAGATGPGAAKALQLALESTHPEWIEACLSRAKDLPGLLRKLAQSRIAWLENRKADALAGWPDVFPDLAARRLREDWSGWEQADFAPAYDQLKQALGEVLASIEVPENPSSEQRKAVAERLADPATLNAVGRARFARACLKAALALAKFKDETATVFALASRARELGEPAAPCLRAEAVALTALGDYRRAHERWISLITDHPVADQQPGDYAEASYTAFENADPRQAMAILVTGLHRFPNDANFALRAGWVALLTGNAERAYRFLLTGQQIGYPPEKLENATALLAIAAEQTGAVEDAAAYYQDLIALDPAWENPDTLESLEWPDDLKASLRRLVW